MPSEFRVLHFSDLHMCVEPNRRNFISLWGDIRDKRRNFGTNRDHYSFHFASYRVAPLEDLLRLISDPRNRIDMLVCTGDMATSGSIPDMNAALAYVESGIADGRPIAQPIYPGLKSFQKPLLIMPGNHDQYGKHGRPGNTNFALKFREYWLTKKRNHVEFTAASKRDEAVVVVAADFSLQSHKDAERVSAYPMVASYLGQGRVYNSVLNELVQTTNEIRAKLAKAAVIWAVHYPVHDVTDRRLALVEREKLCEAAASLKVSMVLSGHIHEARTTNQSGVTNLVAGSCSAVDVVRNHEVHILNFVVYEGKITLESREDLVWDGGMFVKSQMGT